MKNAVPSFISSETILPLRFETTPYTLPRTSPAQKIASEMRKPGGEEREVPVAWMSQEYIAS